jgi:hypothetical protein
MKFSVSSMLVVRRSMMTEVIAARQSQFRVDSLNDLTARPIPAAQLS